MTRNPDIRMELVVMHEMVLNSLARTISPFGFLTVLVTATLLAGTAACRADETQRSPKQSASVVMLNDQECWKRMPAAVSGSGQALPSWAKAFAVASNRRRDVTA
jgi:hypothetical protein